MKTKITLLYYLRKSKVNAQAQMPIYQRITINGQRFDVSTRLFVDELKWSSEGSKMKVNTEEARLINGQLDMMIAIVYETEKKLFMNQIEITGDTIVVKGEVWKMGKEKQITVREILELKKKNSAEAKITGIVQSVEKGKDGYTAKIKTTEGAIYFTVISIPNLGSANKYPQFKMGETDTLFGEIWKMGNENRITV